MDQIQETSVKARGIKFFVEQNNKEVARAFLYIMHNDLHKEPFGLMEDVFVDESLRGHGVGTELVNKIIEKAKDLGCYKLIATSRHGRKELHKWYEKIGFENFGTEFKMYLNGKE